MGAKQYCITSHFELELPAYAKSCFPISQLSCFPGSVGLTRACGCRIENLQSRFIAKQVSFPRKSSRGLFQFPLTPIVHWVPVTDCKSFGRGSSQSFDPLTSSSSGLVVPAPTFLGLPNPILSYSNYAFGIHHNPHMYNLWPRWSFKA